MKTAFLNTKTAKLMNLTDLSLIDKNNLKVPNKNMALANLSIYYTWKSIKSAYNNNKFKSSAPPWNDESDFLYGSYSIADSQDYFEFIIEKHKTLAENPPVQIYANKIKNRILFKVKTSYKLKLLSPETMKLLVSTKKMLTKIKTEKICQN